MSELKFKTNIKCGGCVSTIAPFLNKAAGENKWHVDLQDPDRILTVDPDTASEAAVVKALKEAGYQGEKI